MSIREFVPTIWHDGVLTSYENATVFLPLMNRNYEQEISAAGDQVKISELGAVTVRDYVKGTDMQYDELSSASQYLQITEKKYVGLRMPDVDNIQSTPKLFGQYNAKAGEGLAQTADLFIAAKYADAGETVDGSTGTPKEITSANVTSFFNKALTIAQDNNVPMSGLVAVVPNWLAGKIALAQAQLNTDNSRILEKGYMGEFQGWQIYQSNNISHSGTDWYAPMFFREGDSIAYADQLTKMEAFVDKDQQDELVRAFHLYGAKTIRPSALYTAYVAQGTETVI